MICPSWRSQAEILDRMVGRTEFAVGDPRRLTDELHIVAGIGDVRLDLLQRPRREEAGGGGDEWDLAPVGEPRADAHHHLLGDPHVDGPVRIGLRETTELGGTDRVVDDRDDAFVLAGKRFERRGPCVAAILEVLLDGCGLCHQTSSSMACANWSSSGTP